MNILTLAIVSLFTITTIGCSCADSCVKGLTKDNYSITITKGACFGQCPVFTGTIYGDGKVVFEGVKNVEHEGTFDGTISTEDLCALVEQVKNNGLDTFQKEFIDNVPDAPLTVISIQNGTKRNTIQWKIGTPAQVKKLLELLMSSTLDNKSLIAR
ncbi:MAG: hypothetical protein HQ472_08105 [Ignavibacteria bacterium]|nr:hypothetical protein [Ignavibacteria bacterium]